jgi:hypothetical protein
MLTVHQRLLKNQFLTGIGSGYDKILSQNKPKPNSLLNFAGDCLCFDCCCENYQQKTVTATRTEILNFSPAKPGVGLVLCARGFDSIRPDYEIETAKNDNFMEIFTSYSQY